MESKQKAGHLGEAHEPAEHDMRRQPRIDPSKRVEEKIPTSHYLTAAGVILFFVCFAIGGLKLGGIW
ncbi:hypothetical protein NF681_11285 [Comamonadaceae bacterium OTU4NAUVB1]|nr:hypothetical protein NF681_11285 [Comamonadaceae bacterium OTU4NAUVB1]